MEPLGKWSVLALLSPLHTDTEVLRSLTEGQKKQGRLEDCWQRQVELPGSTVMPVMEAVVVTDLQTQIPPQRKRIEAPNDLT
jgi:hypothetical protein